MITDIYYNENYGKLYEKLENGKSEVFKFKSENGSIFTQFIKREIPINIPDNNEVYYDIVTPYGYGGPLVTECVGNKEKLIDEYKYVFEQYCIQNNIVSEFVRFHPLLNNAIDFKSMYEVIWDRKTLGTNLEAYEDPVQAEFSKSCRKSIRWALNKGVTYRIIEKPDNIGNFKEIYYSTMDRDKATDYYYFGDDYFNDCLKYFKENIVLVEALFENKVIAAGFYFVINGVIHMHLSGTLSEYLSLSPAYVLKYAIALWGKENGYKVLHHGGGTDRSEENSLYQFKKKFAKNTEFDFYIGKKIWNMEVYEKLCEIRGISEDTNFFPKYRI